MGACLGKAEKYHPGISTRDKRTVLLYFNSGWGHVDVKHHGMPSIDQPLNGATVSTAPWEHVKTAKLGLEYQQAHDARAILQSGDYQLRPEMPKNLAQRLTQQEWSTVVYPLLCDGIRKAQAASRLRGLPDYVPEVRAACNAVNDIIMNVRGLKFSEICCYDRFSGGVGNRLVDGKEFLIVIDHDITGEQIDWSIPLRVPQYTAPAVNTPAAGKGAQQGVLVASPAQGIGLTPTPYY